MTRVLILHGYSARNRGDGLLVEQAMQVAVEALGPCAFTVVAADPASFAHLEARVVGSKPSLRGVSAEYRRVLRGIDDWDVVLGVGGGYLRAGYPRELAKTALVMLPQLVAAARRPGPTVYLPQSVGPLRLGSARVLRSLLGRVDHVFLRDDRSVAELRLRHAVRVPDLAVCALRFPGDDAQPAPEPVLSIRAVRGRVPPAVHALADAVGTFDLYVQSAVGGNDDRAASARLPFRDELAPATLLSAAGPRRVVVAVRLHAALMAMAAGHYVVHLAYERKGFAAFADLGLDDWLHGYFRFDPDAVAAQVGRLTRSPQERARYRAAVASTQEARSAARARVVDAVARTTAASVRPGP